MQDHFSICNLELDLYASQKLAIKAVSIWWTGLRSGQWDWTQEKVVLIISAD